MKRKEVTAMPGKVGRVGRKKLELGKNKKPIQFYKKQEEIDLLGGQKAIALDLSNIFDEKVRVVREYKPIEIND